MNFGIYMIVAESTGDTYIGSTAKSFSRRYFQHRWHLKNNKHHNKHLQAIYNKYGPENLSFTVLKQLNNPLEVLKVEQEYLDFYKPTINKNLLASSCLGIKHPKDRKKSPLTRRLNNQELIKYRLKKSLIESKYRYTCYSLTLEPFASFRSPLEAELCLDIPRRFIINCCRKKQIQAGNFIWTRNLYKFFVPRPFSIIKKIQKGIPKSKNKLKRTETTKLLLRRSHKKIAITAIDAKTNIPFMSLLSFSDAKRYGFDASVIWNNLKYPDKKRKKYYWIKIKEYT